MSNSDDDKTKNHAKVGVHTPMQLLGKYFELNASKPEFESWCAIPHLESWIGEVAVAPLTVLPHRLHDVAKIGHTAKGHGAEGKRHLKYAALVEAWVEANF